MKLVPRCLLQLYKDRASVSIWDCDKCNKVIGIDEDVWVEEKDFAADAYSFCTECWESSNVVTSASSTSCAFVFSQCGLFRRNHTKLESSAAAQTRMVSLPHKTELTAITCKLVSSQEKYVV